MGSTNCFTYNIIKSFEVEYFSLDEIQIRCFFNIHNIIIEIVDNRDPIRVKAVCQGLVRFGFVHIADQINF